MIFKTSQYWTVSKSRKSYHLWQFCPVETGLQFSCPPWSEPIRADLLQFRLRFVRINRWFHPKMSFPTVSYSCSRLLCADVTTFAWFPVTRFSQSYDWYCSGSKPRGGWAYNAWWTISCWTKIVAFFFQSSKPICLYRYRYFHLSPSLSPGIFIPFYHYPKITKRKLIQRHHLLQRMTFYCFFQSENWFPTVFLLIPIHHKDGSCRPSFFALPKLCIVGAGKPAFREDLTP